MTIKVGDRLPAGTLMEYHDVEKDGCSIGPNPVSIESLTRGKKVVLFGGYDLAGDDYKSRLAAREALGFGHRNF